MGLSEWHNDDEYEPTTWFGIEPGRLIAAVFFGIVVTGIVCLVLWFTLTTPKEVLMLEHEGVTYKCSFYMDGDMDCHVFDDMK